MPLSSDEAALRTETRIKLLNLVQKLAESEMTTADDAKSLAEAYATVVRP